MDVAKRREARRKRLLESSEDRFKRIDRLKMRTQELEDAPCDSGNGSSLVQASVDIPPSPNHDAAIVQPSASEEQRASTRNLVDGEEDSQTQLTKSSIPSHHASGHHSCHPVDRFQESPASRTETSTEPGGVLENPIPRDISQDSGFVDGTSSSQTSTQACDENKIQHRSKATDTSVQSVVSLQTLVFTVLAAVTRLWLVSLLQGQSIIVLFLATEVLLFFIGLEQSPVHSSPVRILSALLTFRGVSPKIIQRIQRCLGFFQGTLRDFSTFLFVFVMVHATMEWSASPELDQPESIPEV